MAAPPHMVQDQPEHVTFQLDADQDGVPEAYFAHCAKRPMEAVFHHLQLSQDFMCSMETQAGSADHLGPDGMKDGDRPAAEMDLHRLQLLLDAHDDWQPRAARESEQGKSCVAEPKNSAERDSSPTALRMLCLSDTVHHAATQSTNESSQPEVGKPSRHWLLLHSEQHAKQQHAIAGLLSPAWTEFWARVPMRLQVAQNSAIEAMMADWGFTDRAVAVAWKRASSRKLSSLRERSRLQKLQASSVPVLLDAT